MFEEIPLVDDHAHPVLRTESAGREPFARYFSEAHDAESVRRHAPQTLFYRWALRELGQLLGCSEDEGSILEARGALGTPMYIRKLVSDASVEWILLDDGYPRESGLSVDETAEAS